MIRDVINNNEKSQPNKKEIAILKEHFPACFKEDGSFDLERFKEYLSEDVNVVNEGYELKFLGKNYARLLTTLETETVIVPNEEHNNKDENRNSENIYITGDNLDGLKHLLKSYAGKVKCIYIDPPYNTGSDGFVYNDNFNFTVEDLTERLSIGEEQAERILDLTKRGSASHSAWLMFMYPRLQLARDLLSDDGAILISIDDNEQANLKLLCDDIYGEENFIGCVSRATGTNTGQDGNKIGSSLDYVLMYSKNPKFVLQGVPLNDNDLKRFNKTDSNGKYSTLQLRKTGSEDRKEDREGMFYPVKAPDGTDVYPFGPNNSYLSRWRWAESTYLKAVQQNLIEWKQNNNAPENEIDGYKSSKWVPYVKYYAKNRKKQLSNLLVNIDGNKKGSNEIKDLFGESGIFSNPKPTMLIKILISSVLGDEPNNENIVLDFFSGSATTAHAIMSMNNQENRNNIRYIMIQLPEVVKESSKAYKMGYKTIDEIGRTRIIKAAKKIKNEKNDITIDLGFKHFKLAEPTTETINKLVEFNPKEHRMIINNTILDEFGVPTIITTWLNNDGYGLTTEPEKIKFAGYEAYYKEKHLYLVHPELPNEAIEEIVVKYETDGDFNPENVVLFGYSFTWTELESLKTNLKRLQDTEKNLRINFDIRY